MTALAALLGLATALGVLVASTGLSPHASDRPTTKRPITADTRRRAFRASMTAVVAFAPTRWPVAAMACGLLGWFIPELLGSGPSRAAAVARTEAIATWTEMIRDTIAAANGLEAAIMATAPVAPDAIRTEVGELAFALDHEPLAVALGRFSHTLAHPIGDLVVAALTVAANGSTRDLAELLGTLAASARDEAAMHLRVDATRARMRTAARVIAGCTVVTAVGLVVFNPSYVDVYSSAVGQLTLAVIAGCWSVALWWLVRMSEYRSPERFLVADQPTAAR
jgi:Flp pilus assembly protein TadB